MDSKSRELTGLHAISVPNDIIRTIEHFFDKGLATGIDSSELNSAMEMRQFILDLSKSLFGDQRDVPTKDWKVLLIFDKEK